MCLCACVILYVLWINVCTRFMWRKSILYISKYNTLVGKRVFGEIMFLSFDIVGRDLEISLNVGNRKNSSVGKWGTSWFLFFSFQFLFVFRSEVRVTWQGLVGVGWLQSPGVKDSTLSTQRLESRAWTFNPRVAWSRGLLFLRIFKSNAPLRERKSWKFCVLVLFCWASSDG